MTQKSHYYNLLADLRVPTVWEMNEHPKPHEAVLFLLSCTYGKMDANKRQENTRELNELIVFIKNSSHIFA
jgi:hypothetical protein